MNASRSGFGPLLPLRREAFSLVEVALAMGIFTFALVALLGLLPTAVRSARDSLNAGTALQLADKLSAQLHGGGFSLLKDGTHYFDDRGEELAGPEEAVYQAEVTLGESESANLIRAEIAIFPAGGHSPLREFCYLILNNE